MIVSTIFAIILLLLFFFFKDFQQKNKELYGKNKLLKLQKQRDSDRLESYLSGFGKKTGFPDPESAVRQFDELIIKMGNCLQSLSQKSDCGKERAVWLSLIGTCLKKMATSNYSLPRESRIVSNTYPIKTFMNEYRSYPALMTKLEGKTDMELFEIGCYLIGQVNKAEATLLEANMPQAAVVDNTYGKESPAN